MFVLDKNFEDHEIKYLCNFKTFFSKPELVIQPLTKLPLTTFNL